MKLYLCEKPSQAKDIARVLGVHEKQDGYLQGNGIVVSWCLGHLLELAPPEQYCDNLSPWRLSVLPVVPEQWVLQPKPKTIKQFKVLQALLKKANQVVIATDADREGDVIGREVLAYCQYEGSIQRLWLSALDEASIRKGLASLQPNESTYSLYLSGLGRQRADWLIGMNMTMATTALFGVPGEGALSVGRVQTPTLALIVARDHLIEHFQASPYYELHVTFQAKAGKLVAHWQPAEEFTDTEGRCVNPRLCKRSLKKSPTKLVRSRKRKTPRRNSPRHCVIPYRACRRCAVVVSA